MMHSCAATLAIVVWLLWSPTSFSITLSSNSLDSLPSPLIAKVTLMMSKITKPCPGSRSWWFQSSCLRGLLAPAKKGVPSNKFRSKCTKKDTWLMLQIVTEGKLRSPIGAVVSSMYVIGFCPRNSFSCEEKLLLCYIRYLWGNLWHFEEKNIKTWTNCLKYMDIESKSRSATSGDQDERPDVFMSG